MHLDVRRELQAGRLGGDQEAFDLWREEFNTERPHEALGMARPAERYEPSKQSYEGTPDELDYGGMETRRILSSTGCISYQSQRIRISTALGGWSVGLAAQENGVLEVWFANLLLGHLSPETLSFAPVGAMPERDRKCNHQ